MDTRLRNAEKAWLAAPEDRSTAQRYARLLIRAGRREEACRVVGVVWRASPERVRTTSYQEPGLPSLRWNRDEVTAVDVAGLVRGDLESFDPALLMEHFPRCADGRVRLKTTCFLRKYPAGSLSYLGSRLVLLATTGDSLTREERDRRLVVVELQVRRLKASSDRHLLAPSQWRLGGGEPAARRWTTPEGRVLVEGAESSRTHGGAYPIPGLEAGAYDYALHAVDGGGAVDHFEASDENLGKFSVDYCLVRYQVNGAALVRLTYRFGEESTFDTPLFSDPKREVILEGLVPLTPRE